MSDPSWQLHPKVHPMTVGTLLDCVMERSRGRRGRPARQEVAVRHRGRLARASGGRPPDPLTDPPDRNVLCLSVMST